MKSERQDCAVAFLKAAIAYDTSLGIKVERVMTDNGSCYKSFAFRKACKRLSLKHIRTKPYPPKTNGKATSFRPACAMGLCPRLQHLTRTSRRTAQMYNWHRPHGGIGSKPPISRLALTGITC